MLGRSGRASSAGKASKGTKRAERRRATRTEVAGLWCDRGQVLDLSDRGLRITSPRRWSEGQIRNLTLSDSGGSVTLCARCVWCRQDSLFNHTVGLAFDQITDSQRDTLHAIAQRHANNA